MILLMGIIILAIACIIPGVLLAITGLWPRREGKTPYCRQCGYNLTGVNLLNNLAVCTECGNHVTEFEGVVFGERHRRRVRASVGIALMSLGVIQLGLVAATIIWLAG